MDSPGRTSILFACLLFSFIQLSQSATICNPNDQKVLLQIKSHFNNASPFSTWDPKTDCCSWSSDIFCDDDTHPGRVTFLTVAIADDVSGEIPPMVGDLPFLISLRFFELPNLTGSIPQTITKLTLLETLYLSTNKLSGPLPKFLSQMKSLQFIDLSFNSFTGPIPSSLSLLPNIFELILSRNKLTGSIPESFGAFKTGLTLDVSDNKLSGTIPKSLGQANLMSLEVSNNKLSGTIPESLGKTNLTYLDIANNKFTGDASFLFSRDKPLKTIFLYQNNFKFDFTNVDLPQGLKQISIAHNQIYGSLPKRLGQLPLQFIDVSYNKLCGQIPNGRRLKHFSFSLCPQQVPMWHSFTPLQVKDVRVESL